MRAFRNEIRSSREPLAPTRRARRGPVKNKTKNAVRLRLTVKRQLLWSIAGEIGFSGSDFRLQPLDLLKKPVLMNFC